MVFGLIGVFIFWCSICEICTFAAKPSTSSMHEDKDMFQRTGLLLGEEAMQLIAQKRVILFGIGGVGSWCAEGLVRSGIRQLTIVDSDRISITNINRQLHATTQTVGMVKTEVLKKRLEEINPGAKIIALQKIYNQDSHPEFQLDQYDYIIDAIDSLSSKIHLIRMATRTNSTFFSSMGASLKIDPTRIKVSEFWHVRGCPLASRIRKVIKRGDLPAKDFFCIYSEELMTNRGADTYGNPEKMELVHNKDTDLGDPNLIHHDWNTKKAVINGTMVHITAIFGFMLSGLVMQSIYHEAKK